MNKPLYISFCSQKGGVGKTTFTILVASYLHYQKGYNVAVIDCDYPQYSIVKCRERDRGQVKNISSFNALAVSQFDLLQKSVYPVISGNVSTGLEHAEELWKNSKTVYDVIFFDFPGTVNTPDLFEAVSGMDYLFVPIDPDRLVLESSLEFAWEFNEIFSKQNKNGQVHLFWNRVDGRERTGLYIEYEKTIKDFDFSLMQSRIPSSAKFKKEIEPDSKTVFRSTIFPASKKAVKGTQIDIAGFVKEICSILKIANNNGTDDKRGV